MDKFSLHKGYNYATSVMDLERGDILWVAKGRSKKAFETFFKEIGAESRNPKRKQDI
ncbi:transposase [Dialister invisus]|uniref:transposase n=1 Tax=Dialister invisus TaxID=218538 RepID=UPI00345C0A12